MIVPKVTARPETAVLHAVLEHRTDKARSLIKDMPAQDKVHFTSVLAQITGLLRSAS